MALSATTLQQVEAQRRLPAPAARRAIRVAAGVSQPALARDLGVSPATVSRWEAGLVVPTIEHLAAYMEALDEMRGLA